MAAADSPTSPVSNSASPRLSSLRARLIASHGLVLLIAIVVILAISAGLLRREERRAQIDQLQDLAVPLLVEVNFLDRRENTAAGRMVVNEALQRQARELNARLLVFDADGTVRYDTGPGGDGNQGLVGQRLDAYADDIAAVDRQSRRRTGIRRRLASPSLSGDARDPLKGARVVLAADGRPPARILGIADRIKRRPLLGRYLPPLGGTVAAALAVAAIAGYVLSRRIAAPVTRLTVAANAMAAGALEQRVAGEGTDELGRLVRSFNMMSHQVAATARGQRELLANVAHELRTPLTSIRGYAQGMRDGVITDAPEQGRALATITNEAERMSNLIAGLLDLARIESGQPPLRRETLEVESALTRVAERFAPLAAAGGVTLTTIAPTGLVVDADGERLAQILGNLVANALHHTPAGGVVTVSAEPRGPGQRTPPDDPGVRFTVRDTGSGIPPDRLGRVFNRFDRAGEGHGDRDGFGLGLAITRELVAAHGGAISIASQETIGTTVTVDLAAPR